MNFQKTMISTLSVVKLVISNYSFRKFDGKFVRELIDGQGVYFG